MREINIKTPPWGIPDAIALVTRPWMASRKRFDKILADMRYAPSFFIALLYITFVVVFCHYQNIFEFDNDEGNNIIKAFLVDKGFSLYAQIWSDQPPAFTYLLRVCFSVFGWHINVARAVVLGFTGIAIFVVSDMLLMAIRARGNRHSGLLAAAAGCFFLVNTENFVRLSVSVMIGMPSLSLMMLAVWAVVQFHLSAHRAWPIWAGLFAALSLGMKLFTGFLVPLCVIGLVVSGWMKHRSGGRWASLLPSLLFIAGFALTAGLIFLPFLSQAAIGTLWETHCRVRLAQTGNADGLERLTQFFEDDGILFSLAALGAIRTVVTRNVWTIPWLTWLTVAIVVLYDHHPIWFHHRLLLTFPAAVLAGYATGEMLDVPWPRKIPSWLIAALWCATVALIGHCIHANVESKESDFHVSKQESTAQAGIMDVINSYKKDVKYMVTGRPQYAFRARIPVPPNLAITSIKRFNSKELRASDILRDIKEYNVELVIVSARWKKNIRKKIRRELRSKYDCVYRTAYRDTDIWVKKEIAFSNRH
ncbi:MAG: hypothetical protein JXX14_18375 [Deltaproteobacteria bacterium]|nr:hypothetical protein [Deltaproteobacteria bacterium]